MARAREAMPSRHLQEVRREAPVVDPEPVTVLIADDDARFRRIFRELIDYEPDISVVAEASDGEEAIALATEHAPNVALMDIRMPNLSGIEAARVLNQIHPGTKVLMLTVSDEEIDLFEAIKAGASGYLLKDGDPDEVVRAIRQLQSGQAVLAPAMASKLMWAFKSTMREGDDPALRPLLSNRELQILQQLKVRLTTREVGEKLNIPESTVNNHVHNLLHKLHLHLRMQALVDAVRKEMLSEQDPAE